MSEAIVPDRKTAPVPVRVILLPWLLTLPIIIVPLYFAIVALALWGPSLPLFNGGGRVFMAGVLTLLGGLIFSSSLLGEKDPKRTAYAIPASSGSGTTGLIAFPRNNPGEKQSDLHDNERNYATASVDVLGLAVAVTGILLMISSSLY